MVACVIKRGSSCCEEEIKRLKRGARRGTQMAWTEEKEMLGIPGVSPLPFHLCSRDRLDRNLPKQLAHRNTDRMAGRRRGGIGDSVSLIAKKALFSLLFAIPRIRLRNQRFLVLREVTQRVFSRKRMRST